MMESNKNNEALIAKEKYQTAVESAYDYVEHFDLLETITNVGNDEVFTPRKTVDKLLDCLPSDVWRNPNLRWLNPATKNGVFEREIAIRLNEGLRDVISNEEERKKHILKNMIYAYGLTKFTANVARRTLYYCCQANRKCDGIKDRKDGHYVNGYAIGNGTTTGGETRKYCYSTEASSNNKIEIDLWQTTKISAIQNGYIYFRRADSTTPPAAGQYQSTVTFSLEAL